MTDWHRSGATNPCSVAAGPSLLRAVRLPAAGMSLSGTLAGFSIHGIVANAPWALGTMLLATAFAFWFARDLRRLASCLKTLAAGVSGMPSGDFTHRAGQRALVQSLAQAVDALPKPSGRRVSLPSVRCCDGSHIWIAENAHAVRGPDGELLYDEGAVTDVTAQRRYEQALEFRATHDVLTRLPNGTLVQGRLGHAIAGARRDGSQVPVAFVDLDNFKLIIDSMGHPVGDVMAWQWPRDDSSANVA